MRKRALVIESFTKSRRGWTLMLSSTDMASLGKIIGAVRECERERGLLILNRQDPFAGIFNTPDGGITIGETKAVRKKKKGKEAQEEQAA
jgi:hypothetical protein